MPKQPSESRDTRKAMSRLRREGWKMRPGKGDHVNFSKPGVAALITIDVGKKEIPTPIYQKIGEVAGW